MNTQNLINTLVAKKLQATEKAKAACVWGKAANGRAICINGPTGRAFCNFKREAK